MQYIIKYKVEYIIKEYIVKPRARAMKKKLLKSFIYKLNMFSIKKNFRVNNVDVYYTLKADYKSKISSNLIINYHFNCFNDTHKEIKEIFFYTSKTDWIKAVYVTSIDNKRESPKDLKEVTLDEFKKNYKVKNKEKGINFLFNNLKFYKLSVIVKPNINFKYEIYLGKSNSIDLKHANGYYLNPEICYGKVLNITINSILKDFEYKLTEYNRLDVNVDNNEDIECISENSFRYKGKFEKDYYVYEKYQLSVVVPNDSFYTVNCNPKPKE